jgi:hypothetical protein
MGQEVIDEIIGELSTGLDTHRDERIYRVPLEIPAGVPRFTLCYYRQRNGRPDHAHEVLIIKNYDPPKLDWQEHLLKPNGVPLSLVAPHIEIRNGQVIEPQGYQEIHVSKLNDKLFEQLTKIDAPDVQDALQRLIKGYHPLGQIDLFWQDKVKPIKDVKALVRTVEQRHGEKDRLVYHFFIKEGCGLAVAEATRPFKQQLEQAYGERCCGYKECPAKEYRSRTEDLRKDPSFLKLFYR